MENGMNDTNIISSSEIMSKYRNIDFEKTDRVTTGWKKVVSGIHSKRYESEDSERRMPIGERLASNTRVVDLKNGVLLIETDHSGWIQYLRFYQKFILNGLKMYLPDLKISSLAFRVAGSNVSLKDSYEDQLKAEQKKFEEKMDKQQRETESFYEKQGLSADNKVRKGSELPPELLSKFESIKKSMLTNSENK